MREPITIVEIDLPLCSRVFGVGACTAALSATTPRKCFNTRATCKAPAAYDGSAVQTLRFGPNQDGLPFGVTIFPALASVSTNPAAINLSGIDKNTSALGKRARVTITLGDFAYHDTATDPYQAERVSGAAQFDGIGYRPQDRGTFWGKTLARHPYYVGKIIRVRKGYAGQAISAYSSATYVIAKIDGPDAAGRVQITAKDILDLADNAKAVIPAVSRGKLLSAITATDTTATLTPPGIGAEYAASGKITIGREVCDFTRAGDVLTLTRGQDGTESSSHTALDLVQEAAAYANQRPCDVVADLLARAGVPAAYVDTAAWQLENDRWLSSIKFSAVITKPTGAASLIGEICQHGLMIWWDEEAQEIRFRANRPLDLDETPVIMDDDASFLRGMTKIERGDDQRVTSVLFYHGVIDPTASVTDAGNFARCAVASVAVDLYGQKRIVEIQSRWLGASGDDAAAASISGRLRKRFQETPQILTATLDMKDRASLSLGQVISAQTRGFQDDIGGGAPAQMQVSSLEVKEDRLSITAQTWVFNGRYGFIAPAGAPNYSAATPEEKRRGTYVISAASLTFPDGTGPYIAY